MDGEERNVVEGCVNTVVLNDREMLSTFNCGIGMALIISKRDLLKTRKFFKNKKEEFFIIGQIIKSIKNEERCIIN